ncbi:glycosyltransferase, partial [Candidatus Pelagibacter ubique]|nr:glycosyltransferase [Candidatus Pelagibacter ubique]
MRSILITSREPILNISNPTGPGKSIQLIIPIIKNQYKIHLLTTQNKHYFFYIYNKKKNSFEKKNLFDLFKYRYDLVYINGIFSIIFCLMPLFLKTKFYISPRGMLGDEAFEFKALRKKIFTFFLKYLMIKKKVSFISSSIKETHEIKVFLKKTNNNKIFQIGNLTGLKKNTKINFCIKNFNKEKKFKFITPSTISRKKNLLNTIKALHELQSKINFEYDIYGSINDKEYYNEIKKYLSVNKIVNINLKSPLSNKELMNKLNNYDAMLLFTRGENFGHVIPESAKALLPFLISNKTPWNFFDKYFFGLICDENLLISIKNCILNFTK